MRAIVALFAMVVPLAALAEEPSKLAAMKAAVEERAKPELDKVAPKSKGGPPAKQVGWQVLVSPALPSSWPPKCDGIWVVDVYALGHTADIIDGARIAAPWARATLDRGGKIVSFERRSEKLEDLGIQGISPVEKALFERLEAAELVLIDVTDRRFVPVDKEASELRAGYCGFFRLNGVIGARLRKEHGAFFDWLACDKPPAKQPAVP
jgi:hypothetical protein